jgi:catechol 1,2-dioxygenase
MDDGSEDGVATALFLEGVVRDTDGNPIPNAIVDLWHANTRGTYSYFDSAQSEYNLRRRIVTDTEGRYRARSIVPSGYGCNPAGPTQECLNLLGRHGQRPAHIHYFISAPGYRHLTTQINLSEDKYLWDDFAFATRDGLVGQVVFDDDQAQVAALGVKNRFATLDFDFELQHAPSVDAEQRSHRPRALQGS